MSPLNHIFCAQDSLLMGEKKKSIIDSHHFISQSFQAHGWGNSGTEDRLNIHPFPKPFHASARGMAPSEVLLLCSELELALKPVDWTDSTPWSTLPATGMNLLQTLWELLSWLPRYLSSSSYTVRGHHRKKNGMSRSVFPQRHSLKSCWIAELLEAFSSETNYLPATMDSAFTSLASGPSCFLQGQMYFDSQMWSFKLTKYSMFLKRDFY